MLLDLMLEFESLTRLEGCLGILRDLVGLFRLSLDEVEFNQVWYVSGEFFWILEGPWRIADSGEISRILKES